MEGDGYYRRLTFAAFMIFVFLVGGATFYHNIEGWKMLDALYFSSYTLTTVGYGDFTPKTDLGKMFTIFYVFSGVGVALYSLSVLGAHFVEMREREFFAKGGVMDFKKHTKTMWDKLKEFYDPKKGENNGRTKKRRGNKVE